MQKGPAITEMVELSCSFLPPCLNIAPATAEWLYLALPTLSQSYTGCHRMAVPCFCHLVSKLYPISQNGRAMFLPPRLKAIPDITEWPYHVFATSSQSYTRYHRMAVPCFCHLVSKLYPISQNGRTMLRLVAFWSQGRTRCRRTGVPCCMV